MQELPNLYPHQEAFVNDLRLSLSEHRNVIACGVTGFGKSVIAKWIMGRTLDRIPNVGQSGYSLFAVHRRGLVDNIRQVLDQEPSVPYGVLMSGEDTDHAKRLQIASIDTLLSWYCEGGEYNTERTFDLIVFDECHSHHSKLQTYLAVHNAKRTSLHLGRPYVLGLTATPQAKGLADVYSRIVTGPASTWLQENGYAARYRYMSGKTGRLELLEKRGGEFTEGSVHSAMDGLQGDFVRDWHEHAKDFPTIGFFPRRTHAQEAMAILRAEGVDAHYVDGDTPDDERRELFSGLDKGYYPYLCNVFVVERGTDIPAVSCIQICTAIGSRVRYLQMIGRGARFSEGNDCLVLDHGGNVTRHGFWEDDIPWTLDVTTKASNDHEARPTIECPQCNAIYRGGKCMVCGYEPTPVERRAKGLEFDGTELKEYDPKKERKQKKTVDPESVFVSCLYRAGRSRRTWKQAVGMFYTELENHGVRHRVPKTFTVSGIEYKSLQYGDKDGVRQVSKLFPFTAR